MASTSPATRTAPLTPPPGPRGACLVRPRQSGALAGIERFESELSWFAHKHTRQKKRHSRTAAVEWTTADGMLNHAVGLSRQRLSQFMTLPRQQKHAKQTRHVSRPAPPCAPPQQFVHLHHSAAISGPMAKR